MITEVFYPPTQNGLQKTLDANLLTGVTASATLNNVTGIQNKKGIIVIDRVDGNNNLTPNKREYISFDGTSGSTVVTLGRGLGGSTDQDHAVGAIVEFVNDVVQQEALLAELEALNTAIGALPTASSTTTFTNKTLTSPKINEDVALTATATQLNGVASDGWIATGETWAYASASTITVPSGAASKYKKGDKIKFTQHTVVKYFSVVGVADTLLTVTAGSNFSVENTGTYPITLNYYSHSNAVGFPEYFNLTSPTYTSTGTAFTNQPNTSAILSIIGNCAFVSVNGQAHATSGATGRFKATFTAGQIPAVVSGYWGGNALNASTNYPVGSGGYSNVAGDGSGIYFSKFDNTALFTNSEYFGFNISYIF